MKPWRAVDAQNGGLEAQKMEAWRVQGQWSPIRITLMMQDPDPHHKWIQIRIRRKVKSWIGKKFVN
jgi:hypothetical protein